MIVSPLFHAGAFSRHAVPEEGTGIKAIAVYVTGPSRVAAQGKA